MEKLILDSTPPQKESQLFKAVRDKKKNEVIALLEESEVSCIIFNKRGDTPLSLAIQKNHWSIAKEIMYALIQREEPLLISEECFALLSKGLKEKNEKNKKGKKNEKNENVAIAALAGYYRGEPSFSSVMNSLLQNAIETQQWRSAHRFFSRLIMTEDELRIAEEAASDFLLYATTNNEKTLALHLSEAIFFSTQEYRLHFLTKSENINESLLTLLVENEQLLTCLSEDSWNQLLLSVISRGESQECKTLLSCTNANQFSSYLQGIVTEGDRKAMEDTLRILYQQENSVHISAAKVAAEQFKVAKMLV